MVRYQKVRINLFGSTGGASGSGVGLSQAQAVGMGLQLRQIKAQTNLMNAEAAKAYADANKTKGADTNKLKRDIAESEARIDGIIAKIPSEKPLIITDEMLKEYSKIPELPDEKKA